MMHNEEMVGPCGVLTTAALQCGVLGCSRATLPANSPSLSLGIAALAPLPSSLILQCFYNVLLSTMYEILFTMLLLPNRFSNVCQMHTTRHAILFVAFMM
jgi:hypothetical protein